MLKSPSLAPVARGLAAQAAMRRCRLKDVPDWPSFVKVEFTPASAFEIVYDFDDRRPFPPTLSVPTKPVYVLMLEQVRLGMLPLLPVDGGQRRVYVGSGPIKRFKYARGLHPGLSPEDAAGLLQDAPDVVKQWHSEGFRLFAKVIHDPAAMLGFEHSLAAALERFAPGEVSGGLLSLRWLVHVEDCLKVQRWHDDDLCVLCGGTAGKAGHFARQCPLRGQSPRLPALAVGATLAAADTAVDEARKGEVGARKEADAARQAKTAAETRAATLADNTERYAKAARAGAEEGGRAAYNEAAARALAETEAEQKKAAAWPTEAEWNASSPPQARTSGGS